MENDRSKMLLGFLLGAAAGVVAGYLLAGGRREDLTGNLKTAAGEIKEELGRHFQKGEELVDELAKKANDLFNETRSHN